MHYKEITAAHITARKWFDNKNGNTYHNVYVTLFSKDGKLELESGFTYGYGEQWNQTALDVFYKQFPECPIAKASNGCKYHYLTSLLGVGLKVPNSYEVIEVSRKRDL